ncbi:hypothetical protein FRB94_004686 [Tulasnella sp. JGI-2019a]|nr:hypothetical protein FRB94_004686 [Tulasnella sp. JGI-2019a]KAG9006336.1 hypothetical protein FRB93_008825 [Tulasnella sp. JGI-2019a]
MSMAETEFCLSVRGDVHKIGAELVVGSMLVNGHFEFELRKAWANITVTTSVAAVE